jgi:transposase
VADLIRHLGIAEQTFYRWRQWYGGLGSDQVRQFKQLQDGNTTFKRLVADLPMDTVMLQDLLSKILRPSQQRIVGGYLCAAYPISERRACRTVCCARATYHDQSHRDPRTAFRQRMQEMAQTRVRYGYRWNHSMQRFDESASMHTGSSHCTKSKNELKPGGESITRVALTGHSKIGHQRNLPWRSRRNTFASSWSPLETLPSIGSELGGRSMAVQCNIHTGPDWPGQVSSNHFFQVPSPRAMSSHSYL